jgi:hypothetical protein
VPHSNQREHIIKGCRGRPERRLPTTSAEGVSWSIEPAGLVALSDMGMSIEQIARYFSVQPEAVSAMPNRSPVDAIAA